MYGIYSKNDPDELLHYGVKGMKWGVRRKRANEALSKRQQKKTERYLDNNFRVRRYKRSDQKMLEKQAESARQDYEELKTKGVDTKWFKDAYPDEKSTQDIYGMSRKEILYEETSRLRKEARGAEFAAKYEKQRVSDVINSIDSTKTSVKEAKKIVNETINSYLIDLVNYELRED